MTMSPRTMDLLSSSSNPDERDAYSSHPQKKARPSKPRLDGRRVSARVSTVTIESGPDVRSRSGTAPLDGARQRNERRDRKRSTTPESRPRNFGEIRCGVYVMPSWYHAPFPVPKLQATSTPTASLLSISNVNSKREPTPTLIPKLPLPQPTQRVSVQSLPKSSLQAPLTRPDTTIGRSTAENKIWACDRCFKYTTKLESYLRHKRICKLPHPPGKKVYMKNQHSIWEVDGAKSRLYCQNLSLFGKLFIDHKMIAFDVENFLYYVIATSWPDGDYPMGYFSKEKHSADDYNLACIVIFPPHQGHFYGRLLMEFSYYLTRGAASPGTPERPLSVLGAEVYSNYWCTVVLRALVGIIVDAPETEEEAGVEGRVEANGKTGVVQLEADVMTGRAAGGSISLTLDESHSQRNLDAPQTIQEWRRKILASHRADNRLLLSVRGFDPPTELQNTDTQPATTVRIDLAKLATAAHIRQDDCVTALEALGFIDGKDPSLLDNAVDRGQANADFLSRAETLQKTWGDVEITINFDIVLKACEKWHVRARSVLEEACCLA